ncbi:uncharacterized protein Dwil_GK16581 [Drosophila willistoni]|uniref:Tumor protein p53-inducible nuclear protein 1 n=1 Tax=Drosophila willistoni TaxID=7260 RepID=B4MN13_DROWI|nr:uncharacterized protein Dwil_GK16581 [Drosophila willistoni]
MFSSLATFLFGAQATDESTQSNELSNPGNGGSNNNDSGNDQVAGDVIEVTSSTPSVTGNNRGTVRSNNNGKRGGGSAKNRRGKQRQQQHKQPPTITKLLTPSGGISIDEDFDEDEWYIVEKEGKLLLMEESWYVTPPPCFTSIGPINMETSPFENLLIEHPSMSVYRSIRPTQEGTESFVNLDLGAAEVSQQQEHESLEDAQAVSEPANIVQEQRSSHNARFDRHAAAQLKQQTLARQSQKSNNKKQHQQLCRSAIKRSNKVRDFQAKANRPRRSDMQHCKLVSGANNNRKCCF